MMNIAILCNGTSDKITDRVELVKKLRDNKHTVYIGGSLVDIINPYYSEQNALFLPIQASRANTNPFKELVSIFQIAKQLKKHRIDAVIIYGVKNHPSMGIASRIARVRSSICVVNGSGNLFRVNGIKGKVLRLMSFPMLRIAYGYSDYICFQNEDDKKLFISKRLIKDDKKVIMTGGSGVNLEVFPYQDMPDENRFLFLSRITASKGMKEYIEAAYLVKEKYPNTIFDIVGPMDTSVENANDGLLSHAIEDGVVIYHGSTNDVPSWMGRCRFFVYPSYYPEGVPRCALQALATGRPVITCNTPGCKETVIDGYNGFIIQPKNPVELFDKMIWMIENPTEVESMGKKSREYAETKFDVNKINDYLVAMIKNTIEEST